MEILDNVTSLFGNDLQVELADKSSVKVADGWRLEQGWSPSTRSTADAPLREEAPYLMRVVDGRAVIVDYGVKNADGTWSLASDPATSYAARADILALVHAAGTEWRVEDIQTAPLADVTVERMGVYFINGKAVDYTVEITDADGTFLVWARNLVRALQLQAKYGPESGLGARHSPVQSGANCPWPRPCRFFSFLGFGEFPKTFLHMYIGPPEFIEDKPYRDIVPLWPHKTFQDGGIRSLVVQAGQCSLV